MERSWNLKLYILKRLKNATRRQHKIQDQHMECRCNTAQEVRETGMKTIILYICVYKSELCGQIKIILEL